MKYMRSLLTLCGLSIFLPGCHSRRKETVSDNSVSAAPKKMVRKKTVKLHPKQADRTQLPSITIWVHGSQAVRSVAEIFHGAPDGLHALNDIPSYYRAHTYAHILNKMDPVRFDKEHFYMFGWPGDLDFSLREREARTLLNEIKKLVAQYRAQYGVTPVIRVITHSHGGNVALNLARAKDATTDFAITELILLACPIQQATRDLAKDPLFTRVYALYSTLDLIQVIDPQGMYKHTPDTHRTLQFSERRLPLSDNIRQIRLRINGQSLLHVSFLLKGFLKKLPTILDEIDQWHTEQPQSAYPDTERVLALYTRRPLIPTQRRASNTP